MRQDAVKTPLDVRDVGRSVALAWLKLLGVMPSREVVNLLLAQWAQETWRGKSCQNFNLGNVKWTPATETDRCYRACNELLDEVAAQKALAGAEKRTDADLPNVVLSGVIGGKRVAWFFPDHPASAFRAFATLDEGAIDYVSILRTRFESAWPYLERGDALAFAGALKRARYYTAPEAEYATGLRSLAKEYSYLTIDLTPPPVDVTGELESVQATTLQGLSWAGIDEARRGHLHRRFRTRSDGPRRDVSRRRDRFDNRLAHHGPRLDDRHGRIVGRRLARRLPRRLGRRRRRHAHDKAHRHASRLRVHGLSAGRHLQGPRATDNAARLGAKRSAVVHRPTFLRRHGHQDKHC